MFSCVWQWIHVFQRLALESYFPTYGIRFSSRAWYGICSPALIHFFSTSGIEFAFSRLAKSYVFPLLQYFFSLSITSDSSFPAFGSGIAFSRLAYDLNYEAIGIGLILPRV